MSKIFGGILKFMTPWRRWAGPAAVCAAPAAVEIGGELLRGLQEQDALLRPALAAVALAASAAALARRRGDEAGMFPPLLRAADGGKSAARAPRRQGPGSLAAAETSPRAGIAKKVLIGGSAKRALVGGSAKGGLTGAQSGGLLTESDGKDAEWHYKAGKALLYGTGGEQGKEDAGEYVQKAAGERHPGAMFLLSKLYERGEGGLSKNRKKSVQWCYEAAEAGHRKAQFKCGELYEWGRPPDVPQDGGEAEKWYRCAAKQGHDEAMFALGRLLYMKVVSSEDMTLASPQDLAEAEKWLRRAAEYGNARGEFMLGHMYANGWGMWLDQADAQEWRERRADLNGEDLPPRIGMDGFTDFPSPGILPEETEETKFRTAEELLKGAAAALWPETEESAASASPFDADTMKAALEQLEPEVAELRAAANQGGSQAPSGAEKPKKFQPAMVRRRALAMMLKPRMTRLIARTRDFEMTAAEVRRDMEYSMETRGRPETAAAQLNLAAAIILPEVEAECRVETEKWMCSAAGHGHIKAQYYLGCFYYNNIIAPQDLAAASKWWRSAAEQGHVLAQYELGLMHKPTPERRSPDKGAGGGRVIWSDWMRRAAEQGHFLAQMQLGNMYKNKESPDWRQACVWYSLAVLMTENEPDDEPGRKDAIFNKRYCDDQQPNIKVDKDARRLHEKLLPGLKEWEQDYYELWGPDAKPPAAWWSSSFQAPRLPSEEQAPPAPPPPPPLRPEE